MPLPGVKFCKRPLLFRYLLGYWNGHESFLSFAIFAIFFRDFCSAAQAFFLITCTFFSRLISFSRSAFGIIFQTPVVAPPFIFFEITFLRLWSGGMSKLHRSEKSQWICRFHSGRYTILSFPQVAVLDCCPLSFVSHALPIAIVERCGPPQFALHDLTYFFIVPQEKSVPQDNCFFGDRMAPPQKSMVLANYASSETCHGIGCAR